MNIDFLNKTFFLSSFTFQYGLVTFLQNDLNFSGYIVYNRHDSLPIIIQDNHGYYIVGLRILYDVVLRQLFLVQIC